METFDTFEFLLGTWLLERSIEDHRARIAGSFAGTALVVEIDRGRTAEYSETGVVRFGSHRGPASRHLRLARRVDGSVEVSFCDGRLFVDLDLREGRWLSAHPCGDDRHEMVTARLAVDLVEERWRVRGPETSYDALTILRRVPRHAPRRSSGNDADPSDGAVPAPVGPPRGLPADRLRGPGLMASRCRQVPAPRETPS